MMVRTNPESPKKNAELKYLALVLAEEKKNFRAA